MTIHKWIDEGIIYTTKVSVGDVIDSEHFTNLIYRDITNLDPIEGFMVNPFKSRHDYLNNEIVIPEAIPFISKNFVNKKKTKEYLGFRSNNKNPYVVIFIESYCEIGLITTDDDQWYPELIKAKQVNPDLSYDSFGICISFYMNTGYYNIKHTVPEVQLLGTMNINYGATSKIRTQADQEG